MSDDNNSEVDIVEGSSQGGVASLPDGVTMIQQSENGLMIRGKGGKLLPGTRPKNLITPENSRQLRERQKELTSRLIAEEIGKRAGTFPARAVAVAAGDMWEQIVTQDKTNPKYRYDTWRGLAGAAELLQDRREGPNDAGVTLSLSNDLARVLVDKLADLMRSNGQ